MTPASLTPEDYARARRVLMRRDPVLGTAIKAIGPCLMADRQRKDHLTALAGSIVSQQLSTKAAATIFGRFLALFPEGPLSAPAILALDEPTLRGVGLSGQKVRYVRDLCERIVDGRLVLDEIESLDDEAVIARLTEVKGFGRWTAEMFLMFRLRRPDILATGDLGLQKGMKALYKLRAMPSPAVMQKRAEIWRPFRTVGCWYLWRVAETTTVRRTSSSATAARPASRAR